MNTLFKYTALAASLALSTTVSAENFYVGGSIGQAEVDDLCGGLSSLGTVSNCDDSDTGFKIFAGYKFSEYFAVEGFYVDFGEVSATVSVSGTPVDTEVESDGLGLSLVGFLPLADSFDVFAKLGVYRADLEAKAVNTVTSASATEDESGSEVFFGLGASYSFTDSVAIRAEWERFKTDDEDIDLLSAGVSYSF